MKRYLILLTILVLGACSSRQIRFDEVNPPAKAEKGDGYIYVDFLKHEDTPFYLKELPSNIVEIILETKNNDVEEVILHFDGEEYEMESIGSIGDVEYYVAEVEAAKGEYYFEFIDGNVDFFMGEEGVYRREEVKTLNYNRKRADENPQLNSLAGNIWYQIYVDSFRNGNRENDPIFNEFGPESYLPARGRLKSGTSKENLVYGWGDRRDEKNLGNFVINSWSGDFNATNIWEKRATEFYPSTMSSTKRFGGDLEGILEKLDYLDELGVTALWLSPVYYSYSGNKYDTIDFRHVSPDFGVIEDEDGLSEYMLLNANNQGVNSLGETLDKTTWEDTDSDRIFESLIKEVKAKEMQMIMDINFEYVSNRFFAFEALLAKGPESEFRDWFIIPAWDNIDIEDIDSWNPLLPYRGQGNLAVEAIDGYRYRRSFVEVKESYSGAERKELIDWNRANLDYLGYNGSKQVLTLNLKDERLRRYLFESASKWLDKGLDGYRLEYEEENGEFYAEFSKYIGENHPDKALIFNLNKGGKNLVSQLSLSGSLNYYVGDILYRYLAKNNENYTFNSEEVSVYFNLLKRGRDLTKLEFNLLDTIDTDRFNSALLNVNRDFDMLNNQDRDKYYGIRPNLVDETIDKKVKLAILTQYTLPGAPVIVYGSEKGMWGGDTPHNRKAMLWEEYFPYTMESDHIEKYMEFKGKLTEKGVFDEVSKKVRYNVAINQKLEEYYKKMNEFYMNHKELLTMGNFEIVETESDLAIYKREYDGQVMIVALNKDSKAKSIELEVESGKFYDNPLLETEVEVIASKVEVKVEAYGGTILIKR